MALLISTGFALLSLPTGTALVDTGCSYTLIGDRTWQRWKATIGQRGIKIYTYKAEPVTFTGVGGTKSSIGSIAIQTCLGGVRLLLATNIIEGDCPCSISIQIVRAMTAVRDGEHESQVG